MRTSGCLPKRHSISLRFTLPKNPGVGRFPRSPLARSASPICAKSLSTTARIGLASYTPTKSSRKRRPGPSVRLPVALVGVLGYAPGMLKKHVIAMALGAPEMALRPTTPGSMSDGTLKSTSIARQGIPSRRERPLWTRSRASGASTIRTEPSSDTACPARDHGAFRLRSNSICSRTFPGTLPKPSVTLRELPNQRSIEA